MRRLSPLNAVYFSDLPKFEFVIFNIEFSGIEKKEISVVNPLSKFVIVVDDCLKEKPITPKKEEKEEISEKPVLEEIVIDKYVLNDNHFKKSDGSNSNSNSNISHNDSDWEIESYEI